MEDLNIKMVFVFVHTGYEGNNPCKKYMQCLLPLYPHKPQRKAYLFVIHIRICSKKFENNCPFVIANQNKNL